MIFNYISPDPKTCDDSLAPLVPYWQIEDILIGARYILRRRDADEIIGRARILNEIVSEYEQELVEIVENYRQLLSMYPDEAELLNDVISTDRDSTILEFKKITHEMVPVVVNSDWLESEDFAILALLKVDESIDAMGDEAPEDLLVHSGVLLEAYRCLLLAERAKGRNIQNLDEFKEFRGNYISKKNGQAGQMKFYNLKVSILDEYRQLRRERPLEDKKIIIAEIYANYEKRRPLLPRSDLLSPTHAKITIRNWIIKEGGDIVTESIPPESAAQAREALLNRYNF